MSTFQGLPTALFEFFAELARQFEGLLERQPASLAAGRESPYERTD